MVTLIWNCPTPSMVIVVPVILEIAVLSEHITDPDIVATAGLLDEYVIVGPGMSVLVVIIV